MRRSMLVALAATFSVGILLVGTPGVSSQEIPLPPAVELPLPPLPDELLGLLEPLSPVTNAACTAVAVALQDVGLAVDLLPTLMATLGGLPAIRVTGLGGYLTILRTPCSLFPRPDAVSSCKVDDDSAAALRDLVSDLVGNAGAGQAGAFTALIGIPPVRTGVLIDLVIQIEGLASLDSDDGTSLGAVLYRELGCRNVLAVQEQSPPTDPVDTTPPATVDEDLRPPSGDADLDLDLDVGGVEEAAPPAEVDVEPTPENSFVPASVARAAWTFARALAAVVVAGSLLILSGVSPSRPRPL